MNFARLFAHSSFMALAMGLFACGRSHGDAANTPEPAAGAGGSSGAASGGSSPATGGATPATGGNAGVTSFDGGVPVDICSVGPLGDLPACPDDVATNETCDGTIPGCVVMDAAGEPSYYLCNGPGSSFVWVPLNQTRTSCDERENIDCSADSVEGEQRILHDELGNIAFECMGNESSLDVQLVDGCVTLYRSSAHLLEQVSCVEEAMERTRLPCITRVPCWLVHLTTIAPAPP